MKNVVVFLSLLFLPVFSLAQEKINNCPMKGTAGAEPFISRNKLKNRYTFPAPTDFDPAITIEAMASPGVDSSRFSTSKAGRITAYVYNIEPGQPEACNCTTKVDKFKDTHITLVADPNKTLGKYRVIVEVTPRMRAMMLNGRDQNGHTLTVEDWSSATLRATYLHKWIRVEGWYFFDWEHTNAAQNTHKGGKHNWRATCSELHPVTKIEEVSGP